MFAFSFSVEILAKIIKIQSK